MRTKSGPKWAIINTDDPYGMRLSAMSGGNVLTYGLDHFADVMARDLALSGSGTESLVMSSMGAVPLRLQLAGRFNVYNAIAAFSVGMAIGFPSVGIVQALENVAFVPGRFERIEAGQAFTIVVDYAHTPDGLENVLRAARVLTTGQVIVVFGCGGDRDSGKRPMMGEIAGRLADFSVVTSDNPRTEDPLRIIAAVEAGIKNTAGERYVVEPDRREAIRKAFRRAVMGDLVVVAGKGHEDYQVVGNEKLPFDDRLVAMAVLKELGWVGI